MLLSLVVAFAFQVQAADTTKPAPSAAAVASAYADAGTRDLVQRARERRDAVDRSIGGYRTLAKARMSIGVRAVGRDRLLYRQETAARIDWRRDGPIRVDMLGAREVSPTGKVEVPGGLANSLPAYVFEPSARHLLIGVNDSSFTQHPLARGSETDYRFRSGDTVAVRLASGAEVRVIELRVIPRRRDPKLVDGSLWLDARTHAVTRALYRPAAPFEAGVSSQKSDSGRSINIGVGAGGKRRGAVATMLPRARLEVRYITVEYGLHQQQWWMPRMMSLEGLAEFGSLAAPLRLELTYSDYTVNAAATEASEMAAADSSGTCSKGSKKCTCADGRCRRYEVHVPVDTAELLASSHLPPSIFADGATALNTREADELIEELKRIAPSPSVLALGRPDLIVEAGPSVSRFNRVEGLAPGARATLDFQAFSADATVYLGTSNWRPSAEIGVARATAAAEHRVAGYYRLSAVDPGSRALGIGNSVSALLWGRDDGEYFRAAGVELTGTPSRTERQWYGWRVFAEHQTVAPREANWSLRHLVDGDYEFRPNIQADRADQVGAALALRTARGLDPRGFRWGTGLELEGAAGTFRYLRPSLMASSSLPLPGPLVGAVELAAGTSLGDVPTQSLWYLGGPATLRGYGANTASGDAFWRGRAEIANAFPAVRAAVFSDAGWAGSRSTFTLERPLWSIGIGASALDGLIRFDIARALVAPTGWRADLYFNAAL
jgi:hypothetical protein